MAPEAWYGHGPEQASGQSTTMPWRPPTPVQHPWTGGTASGGPTDNKQASGRCDSPHCTQIKSKLSKFWEGGRLERIKGEERGQEGGRDGRHGSILGFVIITPVTIQVVPYVQCCMSSCLSRAMMHADELLGPLPSPQTPPPSPPASFLDEAFCEQLLRE